jgi:GNAT superfamily N-acetyltransferase
MGIVGIDTDRIDEVRDAVGKGLTTHNDRFLPSPRERTPFAVSVRDDEGQIVGGLTGEMRLDWLYVDWLWVDERHRGNGYGASLLALAEEEARKAGMTHVFLWTWSFQAPAFYRSQGYVECGRITDHPKGHDNIQFVKRFG